jgi:hypothetical protein
MCCVLKNVGGVEYGSMRPVFSSCDLSEICHVECHARKHPTGRFAMDKRLDFLHLDLDGKREVIDFLVKYKSTSSTKKRKLVVSPVSPIKTNDPDVIDLTQNSP